MQPLVSVTLCSCLFLLVNGFFPVKPGVVYSAYHDGSKWAVREGPDGLASATFQVPHYDELYYYKSLYCIKILYLSYLCGRFGRGVLHLTNARPRHSTFCEWMIRKICILIIIIVIRLSFLL